MYLKLPEIESMIYQTLKAAGYVNNFDPATTRVTNYHSFIIHMGFGPRWAITFFNQHRLIVNCNIIMICLKTLKLFSNFVKNIQIFRFRIVLHKFHFL